MRLGPRPLIAAVIMAAALTGAALAQGYPPPANPICGRLEGQLSLINRGGDPGQQEQARRFEDTLARQQAELDRLVARSQRLGCSGGFFSLFTQQSPECRPLGNQIEEARANITRTQVELQRLQGGDLESQRQAVIAALAQNNCGPQYQAAANQQRGFFGSLFGGGNTVLPAPEGYQASTYRTLCVRTCDGFYFPVSFQTNQSRFAEDEQACQRLCPATEVQLYTHRNPGEDIGQAVSLAGKPYRDLATAFKYRTSLDAACTCRKPGQSWADALGVNQDTTVQRGDIVVTEDKSKAMAQPQQPNAGKATPTTGSTAQQPQPGAAIAPMADDKPGNQVRTVGPPYTPSAR